MLLYNFLFFSLVLLRFLSANQLRLRKQIYPIVLLGIFAFSTFRFEVGCDWSGYLNQFRIQEFSTLSEALERGEPLWWATIHGIHQLALSYPWVNVASSAIFFLGIHVLARRQQDPLSFIIFLFPILIINLPMSGIRQGVAVGIMCFAFVAFIDKRILWFVIWTLLASMFHSSAIIFMLLAPLTMGEVTRKRIFLAALLAIPGLFFILTGDVGQQAISRYVGAGVDAAGALFRGGLLVITGIAYLLIFKKAWDKDYKSDSSLMMIGSLLMVSLVAILPISSVIADRVAYYLIPIQAMIFARIPFLAVRNSKLYAVLPYIALLLVFVVWTYFSRHFQQCYVPYDTWLFGIPESVYYIY